jgi:hypothetical protein
MKRLFTLRHGRGGAMVHVLTSDNRIEPVHFGNKMVAKQARDSGNGLVVSKGHDHKLYKGEK